MRSPILQELLDNTPPEVDVFVDWYAAIIDRIDELMTEKGYTQKYLAQQLDKQPSEINRWLSGDHNFTIRSLAKLQVELGEILLIAPTKKPEVVFINLSKQSVKASQKVVLEKQIISLNWKIAKTNTDYANAG